LSLETPPSWEVINAQREARRLKAKPRPPKTWHSTTAAVAEAFIDRKAPKGMVSGKSLYFYGPVAYSVGNSLPVAAYLPKPDGSTILLVASPSGIGGTLSGTVGCSAVDIRDAARAKQVEFIEFENLHLYTSIAGRTLKDFAFCAEFSKFIEPPPSVASLDVERLAEYLVRLREGAKDELADSFEASTFPTYRKASAYQRLARLCEYASTFSTVFEIELPEMGDHDELLQLSKDMAAKTDARLEEQKIRRTQKTSISTP
jgi:myosin-crossreactive antigen